MSNKFKMGGGMEDDEGEESDDPLADEPWVGNFRDFRDDDSLNMFPIHIIPSDEVICGPSQTHAKVVDKYLMGKTLGEGSYGKVKEALDIHTLQRRAVKILKKRKLRKIPHGQENVKREIWMLKRVSHKNVISLFDVKYNNEREKIYIVMEFCVCAMHEMLKHAPDNKFPEWQAHTYFTQLISGLKYLHSVGIIHKDLKPSNLLLTNDDTLKISDFGVAEQLDPFAQDDSCVTSQGSPAFQPPEVANGVDVFSGYKLDIWATGVTLFNILTGGYPYDGETIYKLFENIGKGDLVLPEELDSTVKSFLAGLLCTDFKTRFGIKEVQDHIWFRKEYNKAEPAVKFPVLNENLTSEFAHQMTTIPYLEMLNTDRVNYIPDDSASCQEDSAEQLPLKFMESSNHILVKQASSASEVSDNVKDNNERRKNSKNHRRFTPSSCKAM